MSEPELSQFLQEQFGPDYASQTVSKQALAKAFKSIDQSKQIPNWEFNRFLDSFFYYNDQTTNLKDFQEEAIKCFYHLVIKWTITEKKCSG